MHTQTEISAETDTETENFRSLDDSEHQQQLNVDQMVFFIIFRTNNKEQEMMGITQNVENHFVKNHQVDQKISKIKFQTNFALYFVLEFTSLYFRIH